MACVFAWQTFSVVTNFKFKGFGTPGDSVLCHKMLCVWQCKQ